MAEPEDKGPLEKPIDWFSSWKASFERVRQRFGLPVAILLILSVAGGLVWWNWDDIAKRPGVDWVIAHFSQHAVPIAEAGHVTIAVTHLENDKDREQEKLLVDGLRNFEGVETLALDRVVEWPSSGAEQAKKKIAEEEVHGLLKKTGADVLVWGSVVSLGSKSFMRLYWTPSRDVSGAKTSEKYLPQTETLALPELFWSDLKQILGLLTQTRLAEITFGQPGHYVADKLTPLITQVRALVESKEGVWEQETLTGVRFSLAVALTVYGEQSGKNEQLAEGIGFYRKVLDEWTRERVPLQWAATQNNLSAALETLGERESGTETLTKAVDAYREALQERTRERVPLDWAATQNNLGNALAHLGERESGTETLTKAVDAYREALKERTRERVPLKWAATQNNLGYALRILGERESGTETLTKAVDAFREALKEYTRARVPLDWASTQNNLGTALGSLGERESGTETLTKAIDAFREALKELTRERVPLQWAAAQNNLGNALCILGERESGTETLANAVDAFREALKEWTRERVPLQWAWAQNNLGNALTRLGERENGTETLTKGADAYREALTVFDKERSPYHWQVAQGNLDMALALIAERQARAGTSSGK